MPFIEGIGDEVVQFFSFILVVVLIAYAWSSTRVRVDPALVNLVILELWLRSRDYVRPQARTHRRRPRPDYVEVEPRSPSNDGLDSDTWNSTFGTEAISVDLTDEIETSNRSTGLAESGRETIQEFDSAREQEMSSINDSNSDDLITVKLKDLNDVQRSVEGRLQEKLGDFKRRHFSAELTGGKHVLMVFNGRVMSNERLTLNNYGIFNNCVVHCMVRNSAPNPRNSRPRRPNTASRNTNDSTANLTLLLHCSTTFLLSFLWYCRYVYVQMFTMISTASLIGLTFIFAAFVFSFYIFPDRRRPVRN